jgi:uncharacterized membrane protein YraQ (UPF0718 family)
LIFIDILNTFYNLLLQVAPWFVISLILTAVSVEFLPASTLSRLFKSGDGNDIPIAVSFAVLLPAMAAYKVLIAAYSRRGGIKWAPVLSFIAAGSGAGFAALSVTMMIGWELAAVRLVVALILGFVSAVVFAKYFEPRLAATAMDFEVESLLTRDFIEAQEENLDRKEKPKLIDIWNSLIRATRISVPWLILSLFMATLIKTIIPVSVIEVLLSGNLGIVWLSFLGIPFYFVGGAEIPIISILMQKGMGMGGAVVLMLAPPLVNAPVFIAMSRWLGYRAAAAFMIVCWLIIVVMGVAVSLSV